MTDSAYDDYESSGVGWKLFAGIMIIIVGTFNVIDGLVAITNVNQFKNAGGGNIELPLTNNVKTYGWVVLILGAVLILSGFLIFIGNMFGRVDRCDRRERERDRPARVPAALPAVVVHHDPGRHPRDLGHRRPWRQVDGGRLNGKSQTADGRGAGR